MDEYRELIRTGTYSTRLFAGTIVENLICGISPEYTSKQMLEFYGKMHDLQKKMVEKMNVSEDVSRDGKILDGCWEAATDICRDIVGECCPEYRRYVDVPKDRKVDTFDEELDTFCLVIDRDVGCRPKRIYKRILGKCGSTKLYVSNPAFEFWLLLHSDYPLKMDPEECEKMLLNDKVEKAGRKVSYAESKIVEIFGAYSKTGINFESNYLPNVNKAIDNMGSFETDSVKLEGSLGSNIGILLNMMRFGR